MRLEANKSQAGFLENLYTNVAGQTRSLPSPPATDLKKVRHFIARFREALSGFEPAAIEAQRALPAELLDRMKASGVFGLMVPKEFGGLGFTLTEYLLTIEELSRVDLSVALIPLAHTSIGIMDILLFGTQLRPASMEPFFAFQ